MSERDFNPPGFDWAEAQQRYLDAISAFTRGTRGTTPANPWAGALDYWWQHMAPAVGDSEKAVFTHLVNQSKAVYALTDEFGKLISAMAGTAEEGGDWQSVLDAHLDAMKRGVEQAADSTSGQGQPSCFWQLPLENWEQTLASLSTLPPAVDRFAGLPGIGHTREVQEQIQRTGHLWSEYQRALSELQSQLVSAGVRALDRLRQRIIEAATSGRKIGSLRELYDLWVDCSEETYAEQIFKDEYAQCYGELVNALMSLKGHLQHVTDDTLSALNLPTRRGMDTLVERQLDMRREVSELRRELEAIRRRLAERETPAPSGSAPAPSSSQNDNSGKD